MSGLMALVGLMAGCDGGPATATQMQVDAVLAPCERYRLTVPEAYGLCVTRLVVSLRTVAAMDQACGRAGGWESDCHAGWVAEQGRVRPDRRVALHTQALTPIELLEACGPSADCALQQLDAHPDADLLAQIERCERLTGPFVADCAAHGVQRWARGYPGAAEVARVSAGTAAYAVQVGTFVGMVVACAPVGPDPAMVPASCPAGEDSLYAKACRQGAEAFRQSPGSCGGALPPSPPGAPGG
ncbi:MAG: hypothetical protein EXR69_08075 [Myxococcales bacterium]|nr:hypothetical protein [Myxococcales bacterium]